MQNTLLQPAGSIPASVSELRINAVSGKTVIRRGTEQSIRVLATTPGFWSIKDGTISETGGKVAEALALSSNRVITCHNTSVIVNGRRVSWLDAEAEELIVELPETFAGNLTLNCDIVSAISLAVPVTGRLVVESSHRGRVQICEQPKLGVCQLTGSINGSIESQDITATELTIEAGQSTRLALGNLTSRTCASLEATMLGVIVTGNISAEESLTVKVDQSGNIKSANLDSKKSVHVKAELSGAFTATGLKTAEDCKAKSEQNGKVKVDSLAAKTAQVNASMSGEIILATAVVDSLKACTDMSGFIRIEAGNAKDGTAKASMSGRICLSRGFASLTKKQSMGGSILVG